MPRLNFDLAATEPLGDFDPLPEGDYTLEVESSEDCEADANGRQPMKITYRVVSEQFKGRKFSEWLNLRHPSEKAVQYARKTLKSLCVACGKELIEDTAELHFIPFDAYVIQTEGTTGKLRNEIKRYERFKSGDQSATQTSAPTSASTPNTDNNQPFWR